MLTSQVLAQPLPTLTLDQAQQMAAQQNRQVLSGQSEIERQRYTWDSTAAQRLPQISATAQHAHLLTPINFNVLRGSLGNFAATGPIPSEDIFISNVRGSQTQVQLTATQPISQLYKLDLALENQELAIDNARESLRDKQLSLAVQVQQAYLNIVDLQNAVQAAQDSLDFARELERVTAEYLKERAVLKADLLEVRAKRAEQESQVGSLGRALKLQKQQLNHLLARDLASDFRAQMPEVSKSVEATIEQLQEQAQSGRPDLAQAKLRLRQAILGTEAERARYIPDVAIQFAYTNQTNSGLLPGTLMTVALVATWDIFDWGERDGAIGAKSKQAEAAQYQVQEATSQAALEVASRFRQVEDLRGLQEAKKLQVEAAEERHRVNLSRYQVKATLAKDLLDTQAKLTAARRDYQKWQIDLAQAVAELYQSVGQIP